MGRRSSKYLISTVSNTFTSIEPTHNTCWNSSEFYPHLVHIHHIPVCLYFVSLSFLALLLYSISASTPPYTQITTHARTHAHIHIQYKWRHEYMGKQYSEMSKRARQLDTRSSRQHNDRLLIQKYVIFSWLSLHSYKVDSRIVCSTLFRSV